LEADLQADQEVMSERNQKHMVVPTQPATHLTVVQADFALGFFEDGFNRPTHTADTDKPTQRCIGGSIAEVVFDHRGEPLKGRIRYYVTRYGQGFSHSLARAWIAFDQQEIVSFSTVQWWVKHWHLRSELQISNNCTDYRDPKQQAAYHGAFAQATALLHKQELFTRDDFEEAVKTFLDLSIEKAIKSENPLIRMFAVMDRRLGRRRLPHITFQVDETSLVRRFYALRCHVEEIYEERG
jgi:hypothetical protein